MRKELLTVAAILLLLIPAFVFAGGGDDFSISKKLKLNNTVDAV